ncbi:MAG: SRPBCC family protein [Thermodesulfobacteriota bacterium]
MQRSGPYSFWHHKHLFQETRDGAEMQDIVHYALRLGPMGRILNKLIVEKELEKIFNYRRDVLEKIFGRWSSSDKKKPEAK